MVDSQLFLLVSVGVLLVLNGLFTGPVALRDDARTEAADRADAHRADLPPS